MLDLITDRAASDITRWRALRTKMINGTATAAEQTEWFTPLKGAYNYTDLNRVGEAVQDLADLLNGYGYSVFVSPKTDWTQSDIPKAADMTTYLADVAAIKDRFYGTTALPAAMDGMTHEDANNIEKLLLEIEANINHMVAAFRYCGEIYCGEEYA